MKTCFKCKKSKSLSQFYRHPEMGDGRLGKCKACTKKDVSTNYRDNIDHYKAYEISRFHTPKRKEAALKYQRNRRAKFPGKTKARFAVSNAIRDGRLTRKPCEVCGKKAQAHHYDYRKKLSVQWLCFKHHREAHGQIIT